MFFVLYNAQWLFKAHNMMAESNVKKDSSGTPLKEYLSIDIAWGPC